MATVGIESISFENEISTQINMTWWKDPFILRDRWFSPGLNWIFQSSGLVRGVRWFETDVSGPAIGPIFKGQTVQENRSTLEDGTDRQFRNVRFKPLYAAY